MSILLEVKKYLTAYRRLLIGLLAAGFICVAVGAGADMLLGRQSLFEPFTIGVVDNGGSPEIKIVFDFFNEAVGLDYLDKEEAERRLTAGEIPAYVELPDRFAQDIMSGVNTPFVLHGNSDFALQLSLTRLLASGGVAFLSSSQAGIYATFDQAREGGMAWEDIERYILMPINVAFVKKMLSYDEFFTAEVLPLTEGTPWTHYVYSFAAFMLILNLLSFTKAMRGHTAAVYARYKLAGVSFPAVQAVRLAGLTVPHILLSVPLYFLATRDILLSLAAGFVLAFCVSCFGMAVSAVFKSEAAAGLFIFLSGIVMLFISGGIVPLAYLPRGMHALRYAGIPYWAVSAAHGSMSGVLPLLAMGLVFMAVFYTAERTRLAL
jgi:ABC-2 type transport system permease protein